MYEVGIHSCRALELAVDWWRGSNDDWYLLTWDNVFGRAERGFFVFVAGDDDSEWFLGVETFVFGGGGGRSGGGEDVPDATVSVVVVARSENEHEHSN